jgi:uncharacterized membrane protein
MAKKKTDSAIEGELLDKELKSLPPTVKKIMQMSIESHWSGPLPPPEIFKKYPKEVQKAIVDQANAQSKHRQSIEKSVVASNIKNSSRGMTFAFWLTITMIIIGAILIALGQDIAGLVAIFGTGTFQAGNFFLQKWEEMRKISKKSKSKDLANTEDGKDDEQEIIQKTD